MLQLPAFCICLFKSLCLLCWEENTVCLPFKDHIASAKALFLSEYDPLNRWLMVNCLMQSFSAGKQQVTCQHTNSFDVHRSFFVNASFATVLALWLYWTTNTVHWIKKEVQRETLGSSDFSSYIFGLKKTTRKQNLQDWFWSAFFNKLLFFFSTASVSRQEIWHLQWHSEMHWDILWL